jgi:hypothetical protein
MSPYMLGIILNFQRGNRNPWTKTVDFCALGACTRAIAVLLAVAGCTFGQVTLALSSTSATTGGSASLDLTMNAPLSIQPAAVQWIFSYAAGDLAAFSVSAGPAAVAAGKSISCTGSSDSYTCLLFGLNQSALAPGVIATVVLTVAPSTTSDSSAIQVLSPTAASASGYATAVTATGGLVTISQTYAVTALACAPTPLTTPGSAGCSVTISNPAPPTGLPVATGVASGGASVLVPSSVPVPPGATTAGFSADASTVSVSTSAVLVASVNGTSQSLSLPLLPPSPPPAAPSLKGLVCSPATITSRAYSACTATLSAASSGGTTVGLSLANSANLSVPPSVAIPAGSSSGQFSVQAGKLNTSQTATILAMLNGTSVSFSLTLKAPGHH